MEPVQAMLDRAAVNKIPNIKVRIIIHYVSDDDFFYRLDVRLVWSFHKIERFAMTSC